MGKSIHSFENDSVLLVLRTDSNEMTPFSCTVTVPDGSRYRASPGTVPAALVPVRSTDFAVSFPNDFEGAPALKPGGRYHVEWRSAGGRTVCLGAGEFEVPLAQKGERVPHQLTIGLEYHPEGAVEVLWRYPYSQLHVIKQQIVRLESHEVPPDMQRALDTLAEALKQRIHVDPDRLPHREVAPSMSPGVVAVALQDRSRANELPAARMYYNEEIAEIDSTKMRVIRLEKDDFSPAELAAADVLRTISKEIAWKDYDKRF
jgi:hypothetical protein